MREKLNLIFQMPVEGNKTHELIYFFTILTLLLTTQYTSTQDVVSTSIKHVY